MAKGESSSGFGQMFTSSLIFGLGSVTSLHMQKCIQPCTWLSGNMSFLKSVRMVTNHDGMARNIVQPLIPGCTYSSYF